MKNIPLHQLEKEIPRGNYCYNHVNGKEIRCPYWFLTRLHESQNNGYCFYLEIGDWMEVPENQWSNGNNITYKGLLWDQVKLCGINKSEIVHDKL